ncbi:hypothetical protein M422DRAFT_64730 [Sphaerobolus stellatus SS14]|nr:hypothetical protein M422DRAFT_64730 [Sphaerobolus stellatus SS14]
MVQFSLLRLLKNQFTKLPLVTADLTGKTVIVTGANVGIGLETARHLARMKPAKLILACRNMAKADAAVVEIRKDTGIGKELVAWQLDLSKFASVNAFVAKFEAEGGGRLDLLVSNAAVSPIKFAKTEDGWEQSIQVNILSTALLAILLLPNLTKAPQDGPTPRLVFVSSTAHHWTVPFKPYAEKDLCQKLSDPTYTKKSIATGMANRYFLSKLLNILLFRALVTHLASPSPLTVTAVHPGVAKSSLLRDAPWIVLIIVDALYAIFARSSEMASRTLLWAALGGENSVVHSRYLDSCRVDEENDWVLGEQGHIMQDNLWEETIRTLKKVNPRVDAIVNAYLTPK